VLTGDDTTNAVPVANGRAVVSPSGTDLCGSDIALLLLDRPVEGTTPLLVAELGVTPSARVRTVGFGTTGPGAIPTKLLREHMLVLDTTDTEFQVGEAGCLGDSGGPALDESTGAVLGVLSRGGPSCAGSSVHDIFTRADVYAGLVATALSQSLPGEGEQAETKDAGARSVKLVTDYGAACTSGAECGAGVCVEEENRQYCSRTCDGQDKCATDTKCEPSQEGSFVCVEGG
jgi:hypothetical protein